MPPTNETQKAEVSGKDAAATDWINDVKKQLETDTRVKPWKETFGDKVNTGYDGEDKVSLGGKGGMQHSHAIV